MNNVVITGASRGIGLELTTQALAKGHRVLAVARNPEKSKGLMVLTKENKNLTLLQAELTDPEAPEKIAAAVQDWKQVDFLINNAGIFREGTTAEDFLESFHVNSVVPFLVTKALLPSLKKSGNATVVHITSLMGSIDDNSAGGYYAYRSSKAALNMINKSLSIENKWLKAIVIHPGWVKTDMGGSQAPTEAAESASGIWKVAEKLKADDSGEFFDFQGERLPW